MVIKHLQRINPGLWQVAGTEYQIERRKLSVTHGKLMVGNPARTQKFGWVITKHGRDCNCVHCHLSTVRGTLGALLSIPEGANNAD